MPRQILATIAFVTAFAAPAAAQVDPLLFLKRSAPNVLLMVDTGNRMQRDAPSDPANPIATSSYYDPYIYTRSGAIGETTLGVTAANTTGRYRRKYVNMALQSAGNPDKYTVSTISVVTDTNYSPDAAAATLGYAKFEAPTRLSVARAALYQAVVENQAVARFGLYKMRQSNPLVATQGNSGPVVDTDTAQNVNGTTEVSGGKWNVSRPSVTAANGSNGATLSGGAALVKPDDNANATVLAKLAIDARTAGGLLAAGQDDANTIDEPVQYMIDDLKSEALRLSLADVLQNQCRNTVAVLITGGGEGTTASGRDPVGSATSFLTALLGRRIPIIVIAIAPPSADVAQLRSIASGSGGQYFEITKANIDAALRMHAYSSPVPGTVIVPEMVRAINIGIQTAFQDFTDINTKPFWAGPWRGWRGYFGSPVIQSSEFQVTSPIIGTTNLENAMDIDGAALPNTVIYDKANNKIPQRSNIMVTSGFVLPGFDGILRAFRVYKPVTDSTQVSGYKFTADGTRLWIAATPADPAERNLYTATADGTMVAFTSANAATLAPLMNLSVDDAAVVIDAVRSQPLGAVIDSTPAIMNPPSLDPPPDDSYPGFAVANKDRRSMVWVGTNRGILAGLDARTGVEVWGFVPLNLLPKLKTIVDGEPVGRFDYFADGSPKVADVKIDGEWKTYMIVGEGPGGTFYQAFDVTLDGMAERVDPASDSVSSVLSYFSDPSRIRLAWAFPRYSVFDAACSWQAGGCAAVPAPGTSASGVFGSGVYGGLGASATAVEKTVGQTWSDPAVGQVVNNDSSYTVLIGSGFLPYSTQQQANRDGAVAGTTFYLLNAKTGTVFDSRSVGSDGANETVDDCRTLSGGCKQIKNALQSDPVATGPSDSRFITKAYVGDLDGNLWRFDIGLDTASNPKINGNVKLYAAGSDQPIFSSMATVNVGGANQYVFYGTGSDLLPTTDKNTTYHLLGVLDNGSSGSKTMDRPLTKTASGTTVTVDEKVTAFPAVAGDIVFFTTTTFKPSSPCSTPDANLYAFTFIGGAAYDNSGDNAVSNKDTPLVKTIAGQRATAPFIVDQHLAFGTSDGNLELFGDQNDFNNGIGQAGVRILSWRQVR